MIGRWDSLAERLESTLRGRVRRAQPMSAHTTFAIGGPADIFVEPADENDLAGAVGLTREAEAPLLTIGSGSNLLVADAGIEGVVIKILENMSASAREGHRLRAEAGVVLDDLCERARAEGLGGLEHFAGIPGTVGGAVYMNAGAFGHEVLEIADEVRVLDSQGGQHTLGPRDIKRGYRRTSLMESDMIVTGATLALQPADGGALAERMREVRAHRADRIPPGVRCAGSVFKNPKPLVAGRLLEEAGCKGLRVGGAVVSSLHANVILNDGGARAQDVVSLMREMRARVRERCAMELEPEVILRGVSL